MSYIEELIYNKVAFAGQEEISVLFNQAMLEAFNHHYNKSEFFKKLCDFHKKTPGNIEDFSEIPFSFTGVLKKYDAITGSKDDVKLSLSSSGTGGKKTYIYLDKTSLDRITHIVKEIFGELGMVSQIPANHICFTYDPEVAHDVGTAFSDKMLTSLAGPAEVFYTMKYDEDTKDFELDVSGTIKKLIKYSKSDLPLRILGFPAHLYFTLQQYYKQGNDQLNLDKRSFVITGGGWKNHTGTEIPKEEFKRLLSDMLGLPVENIRDHFGMVEHGIPYVDCEYGHLHAPVYSKVVTVDPKTLQLNEHGKKGILALYSPYINSYPSPAVLSTDKAIIRNDCSCGRGDYIELIGRAGKKKHKGCAIVALDKLRGQIDSK